MEGEEVSGLETSLLFRMSHVEMLVSAVPLRDLAGRIVGAVSGFVDITQQKLTQQELDEQRRVAEAETDRKSRFLAAVSHDVRTPANAINLLAELVERSATVQHRQRSTGDRARSQRAAPIRSCGLSATCWI